jgi:hypothetical protein
MTSTGSGQGAAGVRVCPAAERQKVTGGAPGRGVPARLLAGALLASCGSLAAAEGPRVEAFSPEGSVRGVGQVVARFSAPMVALGDPRPAAPFEVDCPEPGHGRWNDPRQWVYAFERELPAGLACRFTLRPGVVTLAGEAVGGRRQYAFSTGGPQIVASLPEEGDEGIDEDTVFLLALDGAVAPATVEAHAGCEVTGLAERIPLRVLQGEDRSRVLDQRARLGYRYLALLERAAPDIPEARLAEPSVRARAEERLLVARCQRPLPPETGVRLLWGRGIASPGGVATEAEQVLEFGTRPELNARIECERINPRAGCLPMKPLRLVFSAPVAAGEAARATLRGSDGRVYPAKPIDPAIVPVVGEVSFPGPFPEESRLVLELPAGLADDAGRPLANAARFPLEVAIGPYPPLARFPADFGVLERRAGGVLPVTLRNLEPELAALRVPPAETVPGRRLRLTEDDAAIARWLRRVEQAGEPRAERGEVDGQEVWLDRTGAVSVFEEADGAQPFRLPKPGSGRAFEVVGIPLEAAGFYVVELASERLGEALLGETRPRYVATAALVTDLSVHFKWGREGSLAWVTSLAAGEPVAGAQVRVSDSCTGAELWRGDSDADGIARIPGAALPAPTGWGGCEGGSAPLLVSARTAEDLGFVLSNWGEGIRPYDFNLPVGPGVAGRVLHTVFDRPLFRAGETVSMKHFLRRQTAAGIAMPEPGEAPRELAVTHRGSEQRYRFPVRFDARGVAESSWGIPAQAKLGTYEVAFLVERDGQPAWEVSGSFRVEQFRVPALRGAVQLPRASLVDVREVPVDLFVGYLAGGGAGGLPVKLRSVLEPHRDAEGVRDYEDFTFEAQEVAEGLERRPPGPAALQDEAGAGAADRPRPARLQPLALDAGGTARAVLDGLAADATPRELQVELEYPDANGEILSVAGRVTLWPAAVRAGLRVVGEPRRGRPLRVEVVTLGLDGRPEAGREVRVERFGRTTYSYRRRLVGGFYAYEDTVETRRLPGGCEGRSDVRGRFACEVDPGESGRLLLRARAFDEARRAALATRELWVWGGEEGWLGGTASDRMDLVPERPEYAAGERARLQARMPFRSAAALVTVEREGVLDAFVTRLNSREPVIEVPIREAYAPNAFVSVLAVRGRVPAWRSWLADLTRAAGWHGLLEGGRATAMVDLARPAYRTGMAQVRVGWRPHRLEVHVTPDAEVYKVRERARVRLSVGREDGGPLPADAEVAVVVVDEGLLELAANTSWSLLERMMAPRGVEVFTSTAQMQVVGKRHYGRKSVPPGGSGGRAGARELFDTLLLWRGRLPLSAAGEAEVEVPLNDSLTAFRVVAVASAGSAHFGTGSARIRSTQDLMLHPGLPPLVREGDRFAASFTLRNATERPLTARAVARVTPVGASQAEATLGPATVDLAPGAGRPLVWEVTVPSGAEALEWAVEAQAEGVSDRLRVRQKVVPTQPVRAYQATLARLEPTLAVPVERPGGAQPGRGGVRVSLSARLADGLAGVTEYMARYPYSCLEQRVSRAVAVGDREAWDRITRELAAYLDRDGLLRYFPGDSLAGSDVLTAYMLALADEAGWPLPATERSRLIAGLKGFVEGRVARATALASADRTVRQVAALAALARHGEARVEMLARVDPEPGLWPTVTLVDWLDLLSRVPDLADAGARAAAARGALRARLRAEGTGLALAGRGDDRLPWLMVSPDLAAVRLLAAASRDPAWREELPALVLGVLARQRAGHWSTTPANAWGVLAIARASATLGEQPVAGETGVGLGEAQAALSWAGGAPAPLDLSWPAGPASLTLEHRGEGSPWALVETRAALPLREPLFAGYRVRRIVTPVEQRAPGVWSRGDVARVRLEVSADAEMGWVVVDAPVPAGASVLGGALGGDSALLTRGESGGAGAWPVYVERGFEAVRAYYDRVPAGTWAFEYTLRMQNPGRFDLPPVRVESLYAPEVFAELPTGPVTIEAE